MRDAVDGALGHLGGIEGARQLSPQRGQRGRPLRQAECGLGAALLRDVTLDALEQRHETQAGVRAGGGAEAEEYHRRDHRALTHARQMLQEDLEEGGERGREENEPALQRERGQEDEQDVDAHGEACDAARTRARRKRGPLQEEHHRHVDQRDGEAREARPTAHARARPEQRHRHQPVRREEPEVPRPPGQAQDQPEDDEQRKEGRHAGDPDKIDVPGTLSALAGQRPRQGVHGGGGLLRHHGGSIPGPRRGDTTFDAARGLA